MSDPIPRGPFDEGLFLAHFNKGREHFEAAHLEEAERELEEAYLLRPRDVRVLNLLGLVYFRQEKLDRAEEVYRKLVAESPEAHTLHYNLGLICLKLNRPDDALSAFLKALELTPDNPKIHFYLGQIYERLHRYKDAIYQYRQAGANMLVRRVEGKLATTPTPAQSRPPVKAGAERPDTKPPDTRSRGPAPHQPDGDDAIVTAKVMVPVSPTLLSASPPQVGSTGTERFPALQDDTLPPQKRLRNVAVSSAAPAEPSSGDALPAAPAPGPPAGEEAPSVDGTNPGTRPPLPPPSRPPLPATTPPEGTSAPGREVFRCVEKGLMEVDFSGKVFLKQGTIYSYSGNLTFWVKEKRAGGVPALAIVTGTGRLLLTDHERDITLMQVAGEPVFVEPAHLLACEEGLQPRYERIGGPDDGVDVVVLEGRGRVALSVASKPLPLTVRAGFPVSVPSHSVIMWTGRVHAAIVDDPAVYEVVLAAKPGGGPLLRLEGEGRVLVEQTMA